MQAYVNVAFYEPAVVQLLLVGGMGSAPSLSERRAEYREKLIRAWQRALNAALERQQIEPQNTRRTAEALVGALDEIIFHLLSSPQAEQERTAAVRDMVQLGLRAAGYRLWALERTADPLPQPSLYEVDPPPGPLALIVGNERAGVDPGLLALCDGVFSLPMTGGKSSLNVAVAFGIAVYHLRFGLRDVIT